MFTIKIVSPPSIDISGKSDEDLRGYNVSQISPQTVLHEADNITISQVSRDGCTLQLDCSIEGRPEVLCLGVSCNDSVYVTNSDNKTVYMREA